MASTRGLRVQGIGDVVDELLVDGSPTGKEIVTAVGVFGGASVDVNTVVTVDGVLSPSATLRTDTANASSTVEVGRKNPVLISVSGTTATTDIFIKVTSVN